MPCYKQTASQQHVNWNMFRILDTLHHTASGLDNLPKWFLRHVAPVFCKQLAQLFNLSLSTSVVPRQWKSVVIRPVPKVATAKSHTDFRPISITPMLTRIMEKSIVWHFLYPAFHQPSVASSLNDQFAFRPTSAIVFLLHTVIQMLNKSPYVIVIATDFSKVFDTVWHITLLEKLADLDLPDNVYNWLVKLLEYPGLSHWPCQLCGNW